MFKVGENVQIRRNMKGSIILKALCEHGCHKWKKHIEMRWNYIGLGQQSESARQLRKTWE
jgi:hypothetical protein